MDDRDPQLQRVLGDVSRSALGLMQSEMRLLKAEFREDLHKLAYGLAAFVGAAAFLIAAITLAADAAVEAVAAGVDSRGWAFAIVGGACIVIALILFLIGQSTVSFRTIEPRRTLRSLGNDAEMLSERAS